MKPFYLVALFLFLAPAFARAQAVSINTDASNPDPSAILDVKSTEKGMLVPRMTTAQRTMIATPATGLLVFDTTTGGFWFFNGVVWTNLSSGGGVPATFIADTDNDTKVQVEKNPDEDIIRFDLGGTQRFVMNGPRLEVRNSGNSVFIGVGAGANDDLSDNRNVALGDSALYSNSTGSNNTAYGKNALRSNTTGSNNIANGTVALGSNTSGSWNTANGHSALSSNTTGFGNTANGTSALEQNTTGFQNTANGNQALRSNTTGSNNTAIGTIALSSNTTGSWNTANGIIALYSNTTGVYNSALGYFADVASAALTNATAIGARAEVGASNCLVLGSISGVNDATASVNVGIGTTTPDVRLHIEGGSDVEPAGGGHFVLGPVSGSNIAMDDNEIMARNNGAAANLILNNEGGKVGIGRTPTTRILEVDGEASKATTGDWYANSDARLKKNITPLNSQLMLQNLLALQGVTYEWNDDKTDWNRPEGVQYGFTAQNIQTVFPTLVEEDKLGFLQTAYGTYDAMTVEAIRALHDEIKVLKTENNGLKAQLNAQSTQLKQITAALQTAGIGVEN